MLQAHALTKSYGQLQVLNGLDLHIEKGEIVAIVGASGAGKSTLLHILGTLDRPDQGEVHLNGHSLFTYSDRKLTRVRAEEIGFVFQFHNLLPEFSALENAMMPGWILEKPEKGIKARALKLFDHLGISSRAGHRPSELSGGEQQRVAVVRALINEPAVVLADEPSGNLDSNNARELHQLFFDLRDQMGQTFVMVTHNEELAGLADRSLEIRDGRILS